VRQQRVGGPQPIATAPRQPEVSLLLFCPERGGGHLGKWWTLYRPRWGDVLGSTELEQFEGQLKGRPGLPERGLPMSDSALDTLERR